MKKETLEAKIIRALNAMNDNAISEEIAKNVLHNYYDWTYLLYDIVEDKIMVISFPSNTYFSRDKSDSVIILESWRHLNYRDFDWSYDVDALLTDQELDRYNNENCEDVVEFLGGDDAWKDRVSCCFAYEISDWIMYDNRIENDLDKILRENGIE